MLQALASSDEELHKMETADIGSAQQAAGIDQRVEQRLGKVPNIFRCILVGTDRLCSWRPL